MKKSRGWSTTVMRLKSAKIDPVESHPDRLKQVVVSTNGSRMRLEAITFYPGGESLPYSGATIEMPMSEWQKIVAWVNSQLDPKDLRP